MLDSRVSDSKTGGEEARHIALSIIAGGVILTLLYFGRGFFITSIIAVIGSFILEPLMMLLVRVKIPRSVASLVACTVAAMALYLAGHVVYSQTAGLLGEMPQFSENVGGIADAARHKIDDLQMNMSRLLGRAPAPPPAPPVPQPRSSPKRKAPATTPAGPPTIPEVRIHEDHNTLLNYIFARLGTVYQILLMASFVPFLVYFMLSWGEHMHRAFLGFFRGEDRAIAARSLKGVGDMVRAFVVGNFVLGVLLAAASSLAFWLISVPFPFLAGTLSGFLSLIPYVGLPFALMPPIFAAVGGSAGFGGILLIVLVVGAMHVFALNLLYPKLVGARVHLNPLVVTFAIMFWGFFWDAAGLLLAIPLTAAIKAVCDNVQSLRPYGRFLGD